MHTYKNPVPTLDDETNLVANNADYILKENIYFAFIDVLGFKQTFDSLRENNKNFAEHFREIFQYYFTLMENANFMNTSECYAGQTSDSLYFYTERADFLAEFLKIFSYFSIHAMTKNVFFRGGVAKGNLFFKEKHQFYGQSVIRAYLLESEVAKNPIILIDENTYLDLQKLDINSLIATNENSKRHFLKPFSYLIYNPSLSLNEHFSGIYEIDEDLLTEKILINKNNFEYDNHNYSKYSFLFSEYDVYKETKTNIIGGYANAE